MVQDFSAYLFAWRDASDQAARVLVEWGQVGARTQGLFSDYHAGALQRMLETSAASMKALGDARDPQTLVDLHGTMLAELGERLDEELDAGLELQSRVQGELFGYLSGATSGVMDSVLASTSTSEATAGSQAARPRSPAQLHQRNALRSHAGRVLLPSVRQPPRIDPFMFPPWLDGLSVDASYTLGVAPHRREDPDPNSSCASSRAPLRRPLVRGSTGAL